MRQKRMGYNQLIMKTMKEKTTTNMENLNSLNRKDLIKRAKTFCKKYCVGDGENFRLKNYAC
jgi:hypothetical protein